MGAHDICTNLEQNSEDTNRRLMEDVNSRNSPADIAVIGFSLKYPQTADSPDGFWSMLQEKKCAMTKWPKDRINLEAFYHRDEEGSQNPFVPGAHFVREDLGLFDAPFFGISATEARAIDPQHRILLETAFRALENAGLPIEKVSGSRTGVYSGSMADDYKQLITKDADDLPKYSATGVSVSMIANRLSWFFNFLGPSVSLDSACSSSLMALDIAVQGLRNGDSDMALITGSGMILSIEVVLTLMNMSFLSPNGRCFSFDDRANGYGRGEGFGVLVIKRLNDAVRDGDTIRAVIRSTGSNQDGHTPGVTQPSKSSQSTLILETYRKAGLDFSPTRYFEAHGTGTAIGDPTEADAISAAFWRHRSPEDPLYIGAVKSNIGHLEGGSGVASLIKTIMVLEKAVIPPNANFETLNHRIDAGFANLKFPTESTPWPTAGLRRVSVNSFGFGGSNAHVILDDAHHYLSSRGIAADHCTVADPYQIGTSDGRDASILQESTASMPSLNKTDGLELSTNGDTNGTNVPNGISNGLHIRERTQAESNYSSSKILIWSASDEEGIDRIMDAWVGFFHHRLPREITRRLSCLDQLALILHHRRSCLFWRSFAIVDPNQEPIEIKELISRPVRSTQHARVGFVFTGQGAAYNGMAVSLLRYPVFRGTLESFDVELQRLGCSWSLFDELGREDASDLIHDPAYSQPLTTAIQIALVELLHDFNIVPSSVVGHSSGEIAAAYAVSGLSLRSACQASYHRGRLASRLKASTNKGGAMMSVELSEHEMKRLLPERGNKLTIACINSPSNVTIAGDPEAMARIKTDLDLKNIANRLVRTGVAYHSYQMEAIASEYAACLSNLEDRGSGPLRIRMISSVTGESIGHPAVLKTPDYWVNNMVRPVQYASAVMQMVVPPSKPPKLGAVKTEQVQELVEVGPHAALQRPTKSILDSLKPQSGARYTSSLSRKRSATQTVLELCGRLWAHGAPVAIDKVNGMDSPKVAKGSALVDLPEYPFNHTKRYWHESSLSKHVRLRPHPRHELLGTPVPDWNPLHPRWRKFFSTTETPWIEDHKVNSKAIYSAAGMIVMAMEAVSQISDRSRRIEGFKLKDARFSHPILINGSERVEVQLSMRPSPNASKDLNVYEYQICMRSGEDWLENCRGNIRAQYERPLHELETAETATEKSHHERREYDQRRAECVYPVDCAALYESFQGSGLTYGPSFQSMTDVAWDGQHGSVATLRTFEWTPQQSQHGRQQHIVHPTTLDAAGQLMWVALTKGGKEKLFNGSAVTHIESAWISSTGLTYPETRCVYGYSNARVKGLRSTEASMFAVDQKGSLRLAINKLTTTAVSDDQSRTQLSEPRNLCFNMLWRPDVELMCPQQIISHCKTLSPSVEAPQSFYQDLTLVLYDFAARILKSTQDIDIQRLDSHMRKYLTWLKMQVSRNRSLSFKARDLNISEVKMRVEHANMEGKFLVKIGETLEAFIRGAADPLETMFHDRFVDAHYQGLCDKASSCRQLGEYLDLMAHKNPHMKLLEIGAGTGSLTTHVLDGLKSSGRASQLRFSHYGYTDISPAFFELAKEKFSAAKGRMDFKTLNIEHDPIAQGYEANCYDLVIAAWVLHATPDLVATIRNTRKLLKPGGKLVLLEIVRPDILRNGFAFGLLPGWWLSTEHFRPWSPCISQEQWHEILSKEGFTGVDIAFPDYEAQGCQENSILISTAVEDLTKICPQAQWSVIIDAKSKLQPALAHSLFKSNGSPGPACHRILLAHELATTTWSRDENVLFLPEIERPYLHEMNEDGFKGLQKMIREVRRVVWINSDHGQAADPRLRMIYGLSRVLSTENVTLTFQIVSLEDHGKAEKWVETIFQVLEATDRTMKACELEYVEKQGHLMVNRVTEARALNQMVHKKSRPTLNLTALKDGPPIALAVPKPGFLDSLRFEEDLRVNEELRPDEIEIEVRSVGVNFRDLVIILGKHDARDIGCECGGIVSRVGSNCTSLRAGDRVSAAIIGCMYTMARCHSQLAVRVPDEMSFAQAASFPVTGITAYHSLVHIAHLQREESILIHSGAGGTGQMAIQIAQSIGAEIFVTVSSLEKQKLLAELCGIPLDHIFYSRDNSFAKDVMRKSNNRGIDVVLNSLSGESLIDSWECIAPFGRFVELGKADIEGNSRLPMSGLAKNVSFSAVDVEHMCNSRPDLTRKSLVAVLKMIENRQIKYASPIHRYPISEIEAALRLMQSGKHTGKIVLNFDRSEAVPMYLREKPSYHLAPDRTYVIAGGFGGLGRSAARWMALRGARNMILLSRSGPKAQIALDLLKELQSSGLRVEAPCCDISNASSLATAFSQCESMPAIDGCLQTTMVLRDSIFDHMTFSDWTTTIQSKVDSSWNLHTRLPKGLSFFIMLSSIAGIIGSPSQGNYAAGNTYQDGLAQYRHGHGLKATSIDLGWMGDVGFIAENQNYVKGKEVAADVAAISEREFWSLLDVYCDPKLELTSEEMTTQPILGLITPGQFQERGLEPPPWTERALFSQLSITEIQEGSTVPLHAAHGGGEDVDRAARFVTAGSDEEAAKLVTKSVLDRLARALTTTPDEIDASKPLHVHGVDSLLAVELRNWFAKVWRADVAVFDITGQGSIATLAESVAKKSSLRNSMDTKNPNTRVE